jgi:hypothetical protein
MRNDEIIVETKNYLEGSSSKKAKNCECPIYCFVEYNNCD